MISMTELESFVDKHRAAAVWAPAAGFEESPETLRRFLESRGVNVTDTKELDDDGVALIVSECPMRPDHGNHGSDTAIIWRPGGIGFNCFHERCSDFRWADVLTWIESNRRFPAERLSNFPDASETCR